MSDTCFFRGAVLLAGVFSVGFLRDTSTVLVSAKVAEALSEFRVLKLEEIYQVYLMRLKRCDAEVMRQGMEEAELLKL